MPKSREDYPCRCKKSWHGCKRIVLTGGPGAGKTAVLEMTRRAFCPHVAILPESAGIIFRGGFWRRSSRGAQKAAQRAIFYVQHELEQLVIDEKEAAIALCDRGSLDGLAYWPGSAASFFKNVHSSEEQELSRYQMVIHLRTPTLLTGYDHSNPLRVEDVEQALRIDEKVEAVWRRHPRRFIVESSKDFFAKAKIAIDLIEQEVPPCCRLL